MNQEFRILKLTLSLNNVNLLVEVIEFLIFDF